MRELDEFEQWAESIAEDSVRNTARKKQSNYQDREHIKGDSRINNAKRLFPGVSDEEALARLTDLYRQEQLAALAKANKEHEQTDGALRQKNAKLDQEVDELESEVDSVEALNRKQEQELDKAEDEIEQMRQSISSQAEINQRQQAVINDLSNVIRLAKADKNPSNDPQYRADKNPSNDPQYRMAAEAKAADVMASLRDVVIGKQNK